MICQIFVSTLKQLHWDPLHCHCVKSPMPSIETNLLENCSMDFNEPQRENPFKLKKQQIKRLNGLFSQEISLKVNFHLIIVGKLQLKEFRKLFFCPCSFTFYPCLLFSPFSPFTKAFYCTFVQALCCIAQGKSLTTF